MPATLSKTNPFRSLDADPSALRTAYERLQDVRRDLFGDGLLADLYTDEYLAPDFGSQVGDDLCTHSRYVADAVAGEGEAEDRVRIKAMRLLDDEAHEYLQERRRQHFDGLCDDIRLHDEALSEYLGRSKGYVGQKRRGDSTVTRMDILALERAAQALG